MYTQLYFKNLARAAGVYSCNSSRIRVIALVMAQPAAHQMVDPIQCMPGSLCAVPYCGKRSGAFVNELLKEGADSVTATAAGGAGDCGGSKELKWSSSGAQVELKWSSSLRNIRSPQVAGT